MFVCGVVGWFFLQFVCGCAGGLTASYASSAAKVARARRARLAPVPRYAKELQLVSTAGRHTDTAWIVRT